jgi:hypothetical protein
VLPPLEVVPLDDAPLDEPLLPLDIPDDDAPVLPPLDDALPELLVTDEVALDVADEVALLADDVADEVAELLPELDPLSEELLAVSGTANSSDTPGLLAPRATKSLSNGKTFLRNGVVRFG